MSERSVRIALVVWAVGLATAAPAHGQQEIFERGNQLYQEGDWAGSVAAYESVITAGFVSPDLYYNLGNAYFKQGELGQATLQWERALTLAPGDADVHANLELGRSLTTDAVEPLPRFWVLSVVSWWVGLLPRALLIAVVAAGWLGVAAGTITRVLGGRAELRRIGAWTAVGSAIVVVLLGTNLVVRELGVGRPERGVILAESVPVRSAPAEDDNLTLFEVHEGTSVRIDGRTGDWAEIVLEDGKVGWVPIDVMGVI